MFFGHLPEIFILLVVALLVFGPKRMMEMGSSLGKAVRELREATKDLNIPDIISTGSQQHSTMSKLSQLSQAIGASATPEPTPAASEPTSEPTQVVDAVADQAEHSHTT